MAHPFKELIKGFKNVEKHILYLIGAVFFVQLIDASFFMLFNYYLRTQDYTDAQIAHVTACRYVAIMVLAFPLGVLIKGRRLKPFFRLAAIALPATALAVLFSVEYQLDWGVMAGMVLFGTFRLFIQVTAMPFIILNAKKETHSESIALYFQTFSFTVFLSGMINYGLSSIAPDFFTEKRVLQLIALLGFFSSLFVARIKVQEKVTTKISFREVAKAYEWGKIMNAVIPTLIIAIGAGFTIPFINLFFQSVHGVDSKSFSLLGSASFVMVAIMITFIPFIQRRYGYKIVIAGFQTAAVIALFIMASTEWYSSWPYALPLAIVAYLLRQPLMNTAGPSTSELSLYYVGERNQEIMSALQAAIWSGSWFFSSIIFGWLRSMEVSYATIFMITVVMYLIATQWYIYLINRYRKEQAEQKKALVLHSED